ncbi:unnamed protein product, partial [Dovyalis caffra]
MRVVIAMRVTTNNNKAITLSVMAICQGVDRLLKKFFEYMVMGDEDRVSYAISC